jgi:hypothetical protein
MEPVPQARSSLGRGPRAAHDVEQGDEALLAVGHERLLLEVPAALPFRPVHRDFRRIRLLRLWTFRFSSGLARR